MRFLLFFPAALRIVCNYGRRARVSTGYGYNVSDRSLGQGSFMKAFGRSRSIQTAIAGFLLASSLANAQNGTPAPRPEDEVSIMQWLSDKGLHDIENEKW